MHWATVEEAMAKASPSFPLTGKDKARGDGSLRRHPYPDLSPSRGKELEQDLPLPFSFAVGVRELMNTLRDKSQNYYRTEFQSWILD